ncbi:azurin [Chryseobacterium sp. SNU WT5]|uniref:azurin n=1 Tax=Chryseobacterium sp. SNU WT5 TaxID=2594269 RepID=UPI00117C1F2E|nr:azurin [Chryseobacterium sp. SNU WT5]QDP84902.1 azurin [Chryseobacterium sp. SNU WT5]
MNYSKIKSVLALLAISSTLLISCNKTEESSVVSDAPVETTVEKTTVVDPAKQDTINITLNGNDKMQYDLSEIDVYEGQTVVLTLNHTGTMPMASMGHNFVLLKKGTDLDKFEAEAAKAQKDGYIPADTSEIIAHTKLIGGGESDTITFQAPEKGTYDFLCSFPGHYSMMKGKFNVK